MPVFGYHALDAQGKPCDGAIEAASPEAAAAALSGRGLFPTEVSLGGAGGHAATGGGHGRARKLKSADITMLTSQVASLLAAGFPITRALGALEEQAENPTMLALLSDIKKRVEEGGTFTDALIAHHELFDDLYRSMAKAGEAGGFLGEALARLSEMREREEELMGRVRTALNYPIIMLIVMVLAVSVIFTFVIPSFMKMFQGMEAALPAPTVALMAISDFVVDYWYAVFGLPLLAIWWLRSWVNTPLGRRRFDDLKLRLPKVGDLTRRVAVARFARTLATLLKSGVPLMEGLSIVKDVTANVIMTEAIANVAGSLSKGERISSPLRESGVFPPMVIHMISLGEETGNLEGMLRQVADRYEREVKTELEGLIALIEPLMTVIMGVVVGGVVTAMILPIFQLGNMAG